MLEKYIIGCHTFLNSPNTDRFIFQEHFSSHLWIPMNTLAPMKKLSCGGGGGGGVHGRFNKLPRDKKFQQIFLLHKYGKITYCFGCVTRESVIRFSDQVHHKPGCTTKEDDMRLEFSD